MLGLALELGLWRPVRRKRVGELQLLLLALGLAFFMRNAIAFVAGPRTGDGGECHGQRYRRRATDRTTELIVTLLGIATIAGVALVLRYTPAREADRALSDSLELSETTGIDTDRIVLITWAASAAALAGIFYALPAGSANPNLGFTPGNT